MDVVLGLAVLGLLVWWFLARRRKRPEPSPQTRSFPPAAGRSPQVEYVRPQTPHEELGAPRERMPFASAGMRGPLFSYAGTGRGERIAGPYAVIDVETTGFSPQHGDRVIEIAVARVDAAGRIEDEYATLLNPQGRDTGAVFVHGLSNDSVRNAPLFAEVAGELLARLDGAVVVAHNAVFEERFLAAEFARAGIALPRMPALCTLWLGQRTFATPNHTLRTLARHAEIPLVDAHAALGDVRAVAQLLPRMLERHGGPLTYPCPVGVMPAVRTGTARPKTRAVELRKGSDGWMASLLARLPMTAGEANDAEASAYLDALSIALEDGKIVSEEAKLLAGLAGVAGLGAAQVAALNERLLESMREAAFEDQVLTVTELRQLRAAAKALGVSDYFDDLQPTIPTPRSALADDPAGKVPRAAPSGASARSPQRRCGHCRTPGHYRSTCPQLAA